ncbi:hypothetical protein FQN54_003520 [Arachnomyces sp. PD_36]|nr:hypothetical protein FQN54_003520 [Arachnomyces sp. PD_36]
MAISGSIPQYPESIDAAEYGDFVESDDEIDVTEYSESPCEYKFYPIRIGEVIDQTYRIDHKLGHGAFSTVWMAHDLKKKKDVALKIMARKDAGEDEYNILEEIKCAVKDTSHLVTSTATFFLRGKDFDHRVLVFPLRGPSVDSLVGRKIPISTRMSAARQLLEALASLHEGGFVHRDINTKNVMWGIAPLENLDRAAKYKVLGRPLKIAIPDKPWRQGEVVKPIEIPDNLRTETFYLGDFGLAMKPNDPVTQPGCPPTPFCSPERLHNHKPSFACDMWSYMCVFTELYAGFPPFHTWANGGTMTTIVRLAGPLPAHWKGHFCTPSKSLDSWYAEDSTRNPESNLDALILRGRPDASPAERKHMISIMSRGFSVWPEKRPTATQLLQDPSFRAIMDIHCG